MHSVLRKYMFYTQKKSNVSLKIVNIILLVINICVLPCRLSIDLYKRLLYMPPFCSVIPIRKFTRDISKFP